MSIRSLTSLAALLLLAACGGGGSGGGDDSPSSGGGTPTAPAPDPVAGTPPDSASQTPEAFAAYLETLASARNDASESLDLSRFLPPKSETAEPTPVN